MLRREIKSEVEVLYIGMGAILAPPSTGSKFEHPMPRLFYLKHLMLTVGWEEDRWPGWWLRPYK